MQAQEFSDFRLVGGTALSLHLGYRMSVDIDLFTDVNYNSVDFDSIELYLKKVYPYVQGEFGGNPGMGKCYFIGPDKGNVVKLDVYYSMDPFFQPPFFEDGLRMATIEEIIAMKMDIVQRGGRKKDFWDLHELLEKYSFNDMIALHKQRFEWTHNESALRENLTNFRIADADFDPICLKKKEWVFIKEDFEEASSKL